MSPGLITFIVVITVSLGILVALYFAGKKLKAKQDEQQALIEQNKMSVSLLVIDKKKMKLVKCLPFALAAYRLREGNGHLPLPYFAGGIDNTVMMW